MKSVVCIAVLLLLAGETDPGSTQLARCSAAVTRLQLAMDTVSAKGFIKGFIRKSAVKGQLMGQLARQLGMTISLQGLELPCAVVCCPVFCRFCLSSDTQGLSFPLPQGLTLTLPITCTR
jgi:hypothetical protein